MLSLGNVTNSVINYISVGKKEFTNLFQSVLIKLSYLKK
jgi:hypothetical protein